MANLDLIFAPVEKVKVSDILPGYAAPKGKSHFLVVDTPKGKRIANMCSDNYGLIPNEKLLVPFMEGLDKMGLKYNYEVKHRNYTQFFVDFIFDQSNFDMGTTKHPDMVYAKLRWQNSYDLSLRYGLLAGIWRKICSNGMMGFDQMEAMRRIHTTDFAAISLSETMDLVNNFLENTADIIEPFEILKERPILMDELEEFIDETIEFTNFPKKQREVTLERIIMEKNLTNELTGWQVYSGFNYQLNHNEEINMSIPKKQKLDLELIDHISYS